MKKRNLFTPSVFLVLTSVLLLLSGCGSDKKSDVMPEATTDYSLTENAAQTESVSAGDDLTVIIQEVSENASQTETSEIPAEETTASAAPETVEEIVAYFNLSANKIKPTAKKVVKNYEKRTVNEDKLDIPDAIESTAKTMMTSLMKDDTEPIVYETREDITNEFLVPNQSYVSVLKPEYVESVSCTDKGGQYVIHIRLKDSKNPTAGVGVGSVCDVIEANEVAEKASFIKKFTTEYNNCEVIATIDKETGNVTHIRYITPVVLALTVDMFGTHDGTVGFTFEKDYSITY